MPDCALTFDDGPNGDCTPELLNVLAEEGVPATFFLVGKHAEAEPWVVRDIVENGHEIGHHTYSHTRLPLLEPDAVEREILGGARAIEKIAGPTSRFFRPPWGIETPQTRSIADRWGFKTVLWDHVATLAPGIVLLHDGRSVHYDCHQQVRQTAEIIRAGKAAGYRFVKVSDRS